MLNSPAFLFLFLSYLPISFGQISTEGLVGYWPFNGNVQDESPNHLPTLPHGVAWTEDRFGRPNSALYLNGDSAYVEVPDHPALHVYNFTYSFWVRVEENINIDPFFIGKRLERPANRVSIAVYGRNCLMNTFVCDHVGNEAYVHSSLWIPKLHTWHNITVVGNHDLSIYSVYLDGEQDGQENLTIAQAYDDNPLTIGVWKLREVFGDFLNARFDDIRIYKRALTSEEVYRIAADCPEGKSVGTAWMKHELPDGKYVAYYIEKNEVINAVPYLFELKSQRPPWQNGWFVGGSLLLACLLALWAQRGWQRRKSRARQLELDKLKAIEQERSRIARDLHDDLGSGLSAIGLLTEIARQKSNDLGLDAEIQQMATTSQELSRKIREIIWMVSARFDRLENLVSYLNHFAVELFAESATNLAVRLPADIPAVDLGGEQRRAFFNSVKTALEILRQLETPRLELTFTGKNPFEVTLRFPGPDVFTAEMEQPAAFGQTVQKLKETGSAFVLHQEDSAFALRFLLYPASSR